MASIMVLAGIPDGLAYTKQFSICQSAVLLEPANVLFQPMLNGTFVSYINGWLKVGCFDGIRLRAPALCIPAILLKKILLVIFLLKNKSGFLHQSLISWHRKTKSSQWRRSVGHYGGGCPWRK